MTEVVSAVLIGVIGGSGLYHLDNLTFVYVSEHTPESGALEITDPSVDAYATQKARESGDSEFFSAIRHDPF